MKVHSSASLRTHEPSSTIKGKSNGTMRTLYHQHPYPPTQMNATLKHKTLEDESVS